VTFADLLTIVGSEPVFASALLLAGRTPDAQVRLQMSRWVKAGKLLQLRRGLYALAPAWRKVEPHPFLVANALQRGSYVSLQSALAFHGGIPEHVPAVTSVGPRRPETVRNALGSFHFNHLRSSLSFGYTRVEVATRQFAFVACPEKALLDLVYLTDGGDATAHLRSLRLQNPDVISPDTLLDFARRIGKPKLLRAARRAAALLADEAGEML
jgi:predicted transcriptional regulator of viral defense system